MQARDFCYWLQGVFEVGDVKSLDEKQVEIIKNHLNLVFYHDIDSQYSEGDGSQEVHDGKVIKNQSNKQYKNKSESPYFTNKNGLGKTLMRC